MWGLGRRPLWMVLSATVIVAVTLGVAVLTFKAMIFISPHPAGPDFRVFYAAGWMLRHGQDPYDTKNLMAVMGRVTGAGGPPVALFLYVPWFALLMVPFSLLPFWAAYGLWDALIFTVITVAAYQWALKLGWKHPGVAAGVAALSTIAFINYELGQVAILSVGFLVAVLLAVEAGRLGWAGALAMAGALLLPQDLWPLVPLLWIVPRPWSWAGLRRGLLGEAIALLALVGAPLLMRAGLLGEWIHRLLHFGVKLPFQGELVGLSGLVTFAPPSWHLSAGLGDPLVDLVAFADLAVATVLVVQLLRSPALGNLDRSRRTGWLLLLPMGIWLLATPYGHIQDVAAIFPLAMLALGPGAAALRSPSGWLVLTGVLVVPVALTFFSLYFLPPQTLAPLGILALVIMAGLELRRELAEARFGAAAPAPDGVAVGITSVGPRIRWHERSLSGMIDAAWHRPK